MSSAKMAISIGPAKRNQSMPGVANWKCPHCLQWSSLDEKEYAVNFIKLQDNRDKLTQLGVHSVVCKNVGCGKLTLHAFVHGFLPDLKVPGRQSQQKVHDFQLIPPSRAKPQPPYIPSPIVADYNEASLIVALSPKASATLSRRCLQGMIRDFFGISKNRLQDEINAIKGHTPDDVWEAIDAVRKIGNIGAHMEKDINVIVDVDENEATLLLTLIEQLLVEWYVTSHQRAERIQAIRDTATEKEALKKGPTPDPPQPKDTSETGR